MNKKLIKYKSLILILTSVVLLIIAALVYYTFFSVHTVVPEYVDEYKLTSLDYNDSGYFYFFVQSDEHYCFNSNGIDELKQYVPQYESITLDTEKYNYIVTVNCEINLLSYSYNTAYKTMTFGIDTYISDADLTKTYDNTVRIYKMKKLNIDYDFKKYGSIGTDFENYTT